MRVTLESTSKTVETNGITCRVWEGQAEDGTPVICLIAHIELKGAEAQSKVVDSRSGRN